MTMTKGSSGEDHRKNLKKNNSKQIKKSIIFAWEKGGKVTLQI